MNRRQAGLGDCAIYIHGGGGQKRGKGKEADPTLSVAIKLTRGSILVVSMTELGLKALCIPAFNDSLTEQPYRWAEHCQAMNHKERERIREE